MDQVKALSLEAESGEYIIPKEPVQPPLTAPLLFEAINKNGLVVFLAVSTSASTHRSLTDLSLGQRRHGSNQPITQNDVRIGSVGSVRFIAIPPCDMRISLGSQGHADNSTMSNAGGVLADRNDIVSIR